MSGLDFDGRVAIVTGAGVNPGLGRAYALELAARGARVLVNDYGPGPGGVGTSRADPAAIAREIVERGGTAIADVGSVAGAASARAIVDSALEAWGRVDVLINNAGVARLGRFEEIEAEDIQKMVDVHLMGSIWMLHAVWPHMQAARYGRVVNISSGAMFGRVNTVVYGAAKGGIHSLTRGLAIEGEGFGIRLNTVGPAAETVAIATGATDAAKTMLRGWTPEQVAPAVAWLSHEDCPVSGKYFEVGGGLIFERFVCETRGYMNVDVTAEDVQAQFDQVLDRSDCVTMPDIRRPTDRR